MKKFNNWATGLISGIITPFIILLIYYQINYAYLRIDSFIFKLFFGKILIPIISLCVVVNLGWFYLFLNTNRDKAAKGVILATIIYAIFIFGYKIIAKEV